MTANQDGNADYSPANPVTKTFTETYNVTSSVVTFGSSPSTDIGQDNQGSFGGDSSSNSNQDQAASDSSPTI